MSTKKIVALSGVATVSIYEPDWVEHAWDCLLNYEDVVIAAAGQRFFIAADSFRPNKPLLRQLRRRLRCLGLLQRRR